MTGPIKTNGFPHRRDKINQVFSQIKIVELEQAPGSPLEKLKTDVARGTQEHRKTPRKEINTELAAGQVNLTVGLAGASYGAEKRKQDRILRKNKRPPSH